MLQVFLFYSLSHDSVLVGLLHLAEQLQDLHQVLLKASEYALRVLAGALMPVQSVHAVGDRVLGQLGASTAHVVVVDVDHAELGLQLHSLGEEGHQLVQGLLCVLHLRVVDKDDAVGVFLDGGPALLVLEVTRDVPELYVDFAEVRNRWGWVSFEVDDSK